MTDRTEDWPAVLQIGSAWEPTHYDCTWQIKGITLWLRGIGSDQITLPLGAQLYAKCMIGNSGYSLTVIGKLSTVWTDWITLRLTDIRVGNE